MANKRMFSIDVTETDTFLEMPLTAQALYFHLAMRGDDDGFVSNPRSIMRVTGCSENDLKTLAESGYIITFRSGVIVISDWKVNNYLRGDRYKPTTFQNELSMLTETANKRYVLESGNPIYYCSILFYSILGCHLVASWYTNGWHLVATF